MKPNTLDKIRARVSDCKQVGAVHAPIETALMEEMLEEWDRREAVSREIGERARAATEHLDEIKERAL